MNSKNWSKLSMLGISSALLALSMVSVYAQSSTFTYQGRLLTSGSPANGNISIAFKLFDSAAGGSQVGSTITVPVSVSNGLFTVPLDFGAAALNTAVGRWLDITVAGNPLSPRQALTSAPYAVRAAFAGNADTVTLPILGTTLANDAVNVTGLYNGVVGISTAASGNGVFGRNDAGTSSYGVWGISNLGYGLVAYGGTAGASASSSAGSGVIGSSSTSNGVLGSSNSGYGVQGTSSSNTAVYGSGGGFDGVYGITTASSGNGVHGVANTGSGAYGVWGQSTSGLGVVGTGISAGVSGSASTGNGVYGSSSSGAGIWAQSYGSGLGAVALRANASGSAGIGIWATNSSSDACMVATNSGTGDIFRGFSNTGNLVFQVTNNGTASVAVVQINGADLAEKFNISEIALPGMVMQIDPNHPGELCIAHGAYNGKVAGVISGANNLEAGVVLGSNRKETRKDAQAIALSGRVWTYCDGTQNAIEIGDQLTTSDTPGYAMAVKDHLKAQGAILGKAMTSLDKGKKGFVLVLVNLQ